MVFIHVGTFALSVVEHQMGCGQLLSLPHFPLLQLVQAKLATVKDGLLHVVQALCQCCHLLVAGILGGVHDATKTILKSLKPQIKPEMLQNEGAQGIFSAVVLL